MITNIIVSTENSEILYQLANFLIDKYTYYSKINIPNKQLTLELMIGVVHTCTLTLQKFTISKNNLKEKVF